MSQDMKTDVIAAENHVEYSHVSRNYEELSEPWYNNKGLLRLYAMFPLLFLASTTLGYDTTLIGGLIAMPSWEACE
jgi:hypothetical protein